MVRKKQNFKENDILEKQKNENSLEARIIQVQIPGRELIECEQQVYLYLFIYLKINL